MRLREMKIDRYSSLDEWQKQARSNIKMAKANDAWENRQSDVDVVNTGAHFRAHEAL